MKNSEIKDSTINELENKLSAERDNYTKLKFSHAATPIENPMKIRESRRLIARMETELTHKRKQEK